MELVKKIIVPTRSVYSLYLPKKMIGKEVQVIVSVIDEKKTFTKSKEEKFQDFLTSLEGLKTDLSNFKFNRDEANDYD